MFFLKKTLERMTIVLHPRGRALNGRSCNFFFFFYSEKIGVWFVPCSCLRQILPFSPVCGPGWRGDGRGLTVGSTFLQISPNFSQLQRFSFFPFALTGLLNFVPSFGQQECFQNAGRGRFANKNPSEVFTSTADKTGSVFRLGKGD